MGQIGPAMGIVLLVLLSTTRMIFGFAPFLEHSSPRLRSSSWPMGFTHEQDRATINTSLFSTTSQNVAPVATRLAATGPKTSSSTTTQYHTTILDGPCWKSLQKIMFVSSRGKESTSPVGYLQIVTGRLGDDNDLVVGMLSSSDDEGQSKEVKRGAKTLSTGESLVQNSIATIPRGINEAQAAATYAYAITHVHSLMTLIDANPMGKKNVDDDDDNSNNSDNASFSFLPPGHVVVVGGNTEAIWAAQALQAMGTKVTLVSTQNPKVSKAKSSLSSTKITVTSPDMVKESDANQKKNAAADDDEEDPEPQYVGFAEALGKFDAVLDTVGSELDSDPNEFLEGTVIRLLRKEHGCDTYMTTMTKAQEIISKEGMLFGPGKVKQYHTKLIQEADSQKQSTSMTRFVAPREIGSTVQTLLNAGVIWANVDQKKSAKTQVRGWEMKRFMESTLWPTDSRGSGTVRYGFPVPGAREEAEEEQAVDDMMITRQFIDDFDHDQDVAEDDEDARPNAFIRSVIGYRGLQQLQKQEITGVLFLSAKWCRTCKRMQPGYRQMARDRGSNSNKEYDTAIDQNLVFCKGEASGREGKMLGRALSVDSVPTFILFDKGERYGKPLSISRLPSKKLDLAIEYLKRGKEWDDELFKDDEA
mmetsp:Transcript_16869/g.38821  ORF Transcript_16869/g.38821 Transcript_16869/m.38821 type:complete len:644 (+) Transcript_16869:129-2060(+)